MADSAGQRWPVMAAALHGCCGVAAGAFGRHALRGTLPDRSLDVWSTAASYQLWHAITLLAIGLFLVRAPSGAIRSLVWSARCFAAGTLLFSLSLYLLVLTGLSILGAITPVGGSLLLLGWILLGVWAWGFRSASTVMEVCETSKPASPGTAGSGHCD